MSELLSILIVSVIRKLTLLYSPTHRHVSDPNNKDKTRMPTMCDPGAYSTKNRPATKPKK